MNWKYIAILSFAIFAVTQVVGFVSGLTFGSNWSMYGASLEQAAANERLIRRAVIVIVAFPMYLLFFHGIASMRIVSFFAVFIGTGFFNLMFEAVMGSPFPQAAVWSFSQTQLCVGGVALAVSMLLFRSNKTVQLTCEDARGRWL
jgi:hypothetical protein